MSDDGVAGLDFMEDSKLLASINRGWVAEAILSVEMSFQHLSECVNGKAFLYGEDFQLHKIEDAATRLEIEATLEGTPEEKQKQFERAWTNMRLERDRLRTLLNGGKVNLIEEVWHIREELWQVLELAFGGPEECPLLESEEAQKAGGHWLLSQAIFRSARKSLEGSVRTQPLENVHDLIEAMDYGQSAGHILIAQITY